MLNKKVVELLNEQINHEFYAANLYLQMSAWCEDKGYFGAGKFLREHADEEMGHMKKLFQYLCDTDSMPLISDVKAPPHQFESLLDVFKKTYEHELFITGKINHLVDTALSVKDYPAFNFLQWYVAEQHEEEKLFKNILERVELTDDIKTGLLLIDQELGKWTK